MTIDEDLFMFVSAEARAKGLTRAELVEKIEKAIEKAGCGVTTRGDIIAYQLPVERLLADPLKRWDFSSSADEEIKARLMRTPDSVELGDICDITQGITIGGEGCSKIFVRRREDTHIEESLCKKIIAGHDVEKWRADSKGAVLIYPYDRLGKPVNLGELDISLTTDQAKAKIDELISTDSIKYAKTARLLVEHFETLAQRTSEKKSLKESGKQWFELHRKRDPRILASTPKIIGRRIAKSPKFAIDRDGVFILDSCYAFVPKKDNSLVERIDEVFQADVEGRSRFLSVCYIAAILNSNIMGFLMRTTLEFLQGEYYTPDKRFLKTVPIPLPNRGRAPVVKKLLEGVEAMLENEKRKDDSNRQIYQLFSLTDSDVKSIESGV